MRRRLDGSSLSATVKTRKSTATRWKPCARWPRNRATPASVALSPESVRDDERQTAGASTQQCCNAWIALRRIWLSLRHGCMAEKHSSNLCKNSCDGGGRRSKKTEGMVEEAICVKRQVMENTL